MDEIYINEYKEDKKLISEYVNGVLMKNIIIFGVIVEFAAAGILVYNIIVSNTLMIIVSCACIVAVLAILVFSPIIIKKQLSDTKKGEEPKNYVIKFGDSIEITEGDKTVIAEYKDIKKIYYLKNCAVVNFTDGSGIIIKNDGFTKGNLDGFKSFIGSETAKEKPENK